MKIRRLVAYIIDWYLITFLMNSLLVIIDVYKKGSLISNVVPISVFDKNEQLVILGILFIVEIVYFCVIPRYVFKGQTIGKKILKIKIINDNGSEATFMNLLRRDLLGVVIVEGSFVPLSNYIRNVLMPYVGRVPVRYLVYLFTIISLVSVSLLVFEKNGRMFHDYIGGTKVVML